MRTRTRLTTPPDQVPTEDDRSARDGERYVPAPGLPREPRIPAQHRGPKIALAAGAATIALLATLVAVGEEGRSDDPSVPDGPGRDEAPPELELPET